MTDDPEIQPEPIMFTLHQVLVVERWPQRVAFSDDFLRNAHVQKATVDGDTITLTVDNGQAVYHLRRDLPRHGCGIVADLVEGDVPSLLKRRAQKYQGAS